jgi:hypothetical protein
MDQENKLSIAQKRTKQIQSWTMVIIHKMKRWGEQKVERERGEKGV